MVRDQKELQAAELLLDRARRDRDEAAETVKYLAALVARYRTGAVNGHRDDDDEEGEVETALVAPEGYGGMKRAVHTLMAQEGKGLKMPEIATIIVQARLKDNLKSAMYSARTAVRALMRSDPAQVKKIGPRYKAI